MSKAAFGGLPNWLLGKINKCPVAVDVTTTSVLNLSESDFSNVYVDVNDLDNNEESEEEIENNSSDK